MRVEPHSITVQQEQLKQEKLEEEEADEPPCPIGFEQNESIATEFCSDIDEVEYDMNRLKSGNMDMENFSWQSIFRYQRF